MLPGSRGQGLRLSTLTALISFASVSAAQYLKGLRGEQGRLRRCPRLYAGGGQRAAADWVRAGLNTNQPMWGVRGGLLWAVPPGGFRAAGGPRGLIRLGYPISTNGGYSLINFIAVEPIVNGRRGFSELELSALDHTRGKRIWAVGETNLASAAAQPVLVPGRLSRPAPGVEQLEVTVRVEPFDNGARVRLVVSQRSDAPDEIQLAVHADPGSAPLDYCILTATMGNLARTRLLWLKDEVVSSLRLYPEHKGDGFAPPRIYPLDRLARTHVRRCAGGGDHRRGGSLRSVYPFPGRRSWHYGGAKVTQYWKKPRGTVRDDLHVAVERPLHLLADAPAHPRRCGVRELRAARAFSRGSGLHLRHHPPDPGATRARAPRAPELGD